MMRPGPGVGTRSLARAGYRQIVMSQAVDRSEGGDAAVVGPPLPTFLIIGAQKSATRWLRHNLGAHPDIFTARYELGFFNSPKRYELLGVDWYRRQFDGWNGERIVGEATPGYMMWRHEPQAVAERMKRTIPDVRLMAVLRNPVDRANSAMVHHIKYERLHPRSSLLDLSRKKPPEDDKLGLVTGGWYAASLEPFRALFGDQLLVMLHDDIRDDPRRAYALALRHIGAAPGFEPSDLEELVYSNQQGDSARWKRDVSSDERQALYDYFSDDLRKLEQMIGRDLSIWDPARS
jgi:Sulfotransferase domain